MKKCTFEDISDISVKMDNLFPTRFVIELGKEQYFQSWNKKRICCSGLSRARYFKSCKKAEAYIGRFLGFAGLNPYVCHVCWTLLAFDEHKLGTKAFWADHRFVTDDREAVRFCSYQEAEDCQREKKLWESSVIDLYSFREKQIATAA